MFQVLDCSILPSVSDIEKPCDKYDVEKNEIFFNTRNKNFGDILEFYRTGKQGSRMRTSIPAPLGDRSPARDSI